MTPARNAFVTGGTSGIGLATVRRLAGAGWKVASVGRRDPPGGATPDSVLCIRCDVTEDGALGSAFARAEEQFGKLDLVFNNAGAENIGGSIEEQDAQDFRDLIEINLIAVYNGLHFGPAHMRDGGVILNTASVAALTHLPGYAQYAATKAAIISLTRSAAIELSPRRIRVNAIAPGSIWSGMLAPDNPEVGLVEIACPLGRVGEPDEIAGLVEFLAGDDARYINGQVIPVDGGVSAGFSGALIEKLTS